MYIYIYMYTYIYIYMYIYSGPAAELARPPATKACAAPRRASAIRGVRTVVEGYIYIYIYIYVRCVYVCICIE